MVKTTILHNYIQINQKIPKVFGTSLKGVYKVKLLNNPFATFT